jgi:predicted nucleotidyltransferase
LLQQEEGILGKKDFRRGPTGGALPGLKLSIEDASSRLRELMQRENVVVSYLFGSCARRTTQPDSDVDIAVLLDGRGEEMYEPFRRLLVGVCDALETERVDLLLLNSAPPTLKFEVITTGRVLYARSDEALNDFEADASRRYLDTARLRAVQGEYLRQRAQAWYSENAT